jgi:hypothetical protein
LLKAVNEVSGCAANGLGTYTGTNSGTATVDVDEIGNRFRGYAYLFENNPALPDTRAEINVAEPAGNSLVAQLPVSPQTGIRAGLRLPPIIPRAQDG